MTLTKRQKEVYDYVARFITRHGYAPTLEELGAHFRLSSLATVHKHLSNLERKGLIRRRWNCSRAIELVPRAAEHGRTVELPMLGYVAAGRPIEAVEMADQFAVPEEFVRRDRTYVLRVRGDSMVEEGILDGDFVVVEERETAENGETVIAMVNGEATIKRFYRDGDSRVRLVPANATMAPLEYPAEAVTVRGVVVAVMRKY